MNNIQPIISRVWLKGFKTSNACLVGLECYWYCANYKLLKGGIPLKQLSMYNSTGRYLSCTNTAQRPWTEPIEQCPDPRTNVCTDTDSFSKEPVSKEPVTFNVKKQGYSSAARNHQLYVTFEPQSNYGKHNTLVIAGLNLPTFGLRVGAFYPQRHYLINMIRNLLIIPITLRLLPSNHAVEWS